MGRPIHALQTIAAAVALDMTGLRRAIHRDPEVSWQEHRTTARVADTLRTEGLDPVVRHDGTGLTVDVGESPTVGFRADLDALRLTEQTNVPFKSENEGMMHACGHDVHTAIATGAAITLHRLGLGDVGFRFLFQPAEEAIPGGATRMVAEGAATGLEAIAAFHVDPSIPAGTVGLRTGPITGAADRVVIKLSGPGGHTSRPHQTVDLVRVASELVVRLQSTIRRTVDPREALAIVFGRMQGGTADNVIPSEMEIGGTIRLFNLDLWRSMPKLIEETAQELVGPSGAETVVEYHPGSPPVVNDPGVIAAFRRAAQLTLPDDGIRIAHQSLGSEDFSWFLETTPGALIRLGCAPDGSPVDLHSATFDADERCIEHGITVAATAMMDLAGLSLDDE